MIDPDSSSIKSFKAPSDTDLEDTFDVEEVDISKISKKALQKKFQFLNNIGLEDEKKPDFNKLSESLQNLFRIENAIILKILLFKDSWIIKEKLKGINERLKIDEVFEGLFELPNGIEFLLKIQIVFKEEYKLRIKLEVKSSTERSSIRKRIISLLDKSNNDLNYNSSNIPEEFDTFLPLEEISEFKFSSFIFYDTMDNNGTIESLLIDLRKLEELD